MDFCGCRNEYPLWVYPRAAPVCPDRIYETERLDARAEEALRGGGRVLICSMGLRALLKYPEARALQSAIYHYMDSADFAPAQALPLSALRALAR